MKTVENPEVKFPDWKQFCRMMGINVWVWLAVFSDICFVAAKFEFQIISLMWRSMRPLSENDLSKIAIFSFVNLPSWLLFLSWYLIGRQSSHMSYVDEYRVTTPDMKKIITFLMLMILSFAIIIPVMDYIQRAYSIWSRGDWYNARGSLRIQSDHAIYNLREFVYFIYSITIFLPKALIFFLIYLRYSSIRIVVVVCLIFNFACEANDSLYYFASHFSLVRIYLNELTRVDMLLSSFFILIVRSIPLMLVLFFCYLKRNWIYRRTTEVFFPGFVNQ